MEENLDELEAGDVSDDDEDVVGPAEAVAELVEASIHTILYERHIYPTDFFTRKRRFGASVVQCQNDTIRSYINEVVTVLGEEVFHDRLDKVSIVTKCANGAPMERFSFAIEVLDDESAEPRSSLDPLLRSFMVALSEADYMQSASDGESEDMTFSVVMEQKPGCAQEVGEDEPVQSDGKVQAQFITDHVEDAARRHFDDLTPLQIIETSMMKISFFFEKYDANTS